MNHATAAALLAPYLPRAAGAGPDAGALAPLGEGDFCLAFRLGGQVVRVARHRRAARAIRREACALARIADALPLPVPRPTYHAPLGGPRFTLHALLDGEALTRDGWLALPPAARAAAAADLARFLDALHALPLSAVSACGIPALDRTSVARALRQRSGALRPLLSPEAGWRLAAALARWSAPLAGGDPPPTLLHRDVGPEHLLHDPRTGRLTGVLDFGDLALGDPARDFVYVYEDGGPELLTAVLDRYRREPAASLRPRIRMWYLLEAVGWALRMRAAGRLAAARHAAAGIARELAEPVP